MVAEQILTLKSLQKYASNSHYAETVGTTIPIEDDASEQTSDDRCAICLEKYISGDEVSFSRQCCHMFHKECITEWLLRKECCPYCRLQFFIPTRACADFPLEEQRQNEEDVENQTNEGSAQTTTDSGEIET